MSLPDDMLRRLEELLQPVNDAHFMYINNNTSTALVIDDILLARTDFFNDVRGSYRDQLTDVQEMVGQLVKLLDCLVDGARGVRELLELRIDVVQPEFRAAARDFHKEGANLADTRISLRKKLLYINKLATAILAYQKGSLSNVSVAIVTFANLCTALTKFRDHDHAALEALRKRWLIKVDAVVDRAGLRLHEHSVHDRMPDDDSEI